MSYKPFTTEYTYQIIDDIKEYLEETNKDQTTLDTLDLCHLIGEIERLNKELDKTRLSELNKEYIINELEKWLDEESEKTILSTGHLTCLMMCKSKLQELKRK